MAKVIARPTTSELYDNDFALWAERQAALLRARRFDELDLDHLIEEVEDLSRRERDTTEGLLALTGLAGSCGQLAVRLEGGAVP